MAYFICQIKLNIDSIFRFLYKNFEPFKNPDSRLRQAKKKAIYWFLLLLGHIYQDFRLYCTQKSYILLSLVNNQSINFLHWLQLFSKLSTWSSRSCTTIKMHAYLDQSKIYHTFEYSMRKENYEEATKTMHWLTDERDQWMKCTMHESFDSWSNYGTE